VTRLTRTEHGENSIQQALQGLLCRALTGKTA
jgi:hypothetical protein